MHPMVQRLWMINHHLLELDDTRIKLLAGSEEDAQRIFKQKRLINRRDALLSHLLQRHACGALAKLRSDEVQIKRTKGGKPFAAVTPAAHCPNFNFNASHDGEYVVLAASTHFLTGVDVHKLMPAHKVAHLEMTHTAVQRQRADDLRPEQRTVWAQALFCAKEAYTKAIGVGMGQAFEAIEFDPAFQDDGYSTWADPPATGAALPWKGRVHHLSAGKQSDQGEWCLELRWIDPNHMLVTATGDVARAVDADGEFKSRLTRPGLCPSSVEEGSCGVPRPIRLFELLSRSQLAAFEQSELAKDSVQRLWISRNSQISSVDSLQRLLIETCCDQEHAAAIARRKRRVDRGRALLSHLLQRHACGALAKLRSDEVQIKRTKGGKPFAAVTPAAHCPNFNFNASHDGEYVVLAASTHFLTGVDVHKLMPAHKVAHLEMTHTAVQRNQADQMSQEQRTVWAQALFCAKEAYSTAIGIGLVQHDVINLPDSVLERYDSMEFEPPLPLAWADPPATGAALPWKGRVHHLSAGKQSDQGEWCLELRWIDPNHMLVTATGDVARAVDADGEFKSRLTRPGLCPSSVEEGSCGVPRPIRLFELLSRSQLAAFEQAQKSLCCQKSLRSPSVENQKPSSPDSAYSPDDPPSTMVGNPLTDLDPSLSFYGVNNGS